MIELKLTRDQAVVLTYAIEALETRHGWLAWIEGATDDEEKNAYAALGNVRLLLDAAIVKHDNMLGRTKAMISGPRDDEREAGELEDARRRSRYE